MLARSVKEIVIYKHKLEMEMKDLKIKVNNEAESKEVQELFFELGYEWANLGKTQNNMVVFGDYIFPIDCKILNYGLGLGKDEITIAELRSMVKPMKEYLIPSRNYEYILTDAREALEPHAEGWISIPDGADFYVKSKIIEDNFFFCMDNSGVIETYDTMLKNQWHREILKTQHLSKNYEILWQRPTQPEALPFIDDEPQSLCEQYAEIEQVRQAEIHGIVKAKPDFNFEAAQAIGGVEATIAERQSTYGSFEDVAFVTENIMSVLGHVRLNGLSELPTTHRMALYMIASKMARIVNGDFNHLDSWHDIGGYAKLIEDLIKENNNG